MAITSPSPAVIELTRGIIEDKVYTNESAELMFTVTEGWGYATYEMIGTVAGTGAGAASMSDFIASAR